MNGTEGCIWLQNGILPTNPPTTPDNSISPLSNPENFRQYLYPGKFSSQTEKRRIGHTPAFYVFWTWPKIRKSGDQPCPSPKVN